MIQDSLQALQDSHYLLEDVDKLTAFWIPNGHSMPNMEQLQHCPSWKEIKVGHGFSVCILICRDCNLMCNNNLGKGGNL